MLEGDVRADFACDGSALVKLLHEIASLSEEVDRRHAEVARLEAGLRRARLQLTEMRGDDELVGVKMDDVGDSGGTVR